MRWQRFTAAAVPKLAVALVASGLIGEEAVRHALER